MDNHPIPQDITGFQFKLIGAMTIRQFAYLAIGVVIAFIFFFLLPIPFLIKLPVSIVSLLIGIAFAFMPVGGRPMDTMVSNFFKALFAPTQYIYKKTGGDLSQEQNYADADTQKTAENLAPVDPVPATQAQTYPPQAPQPLPSPILTLDDEPSQNMKNTIDYEKKLAEAKEQKEALEKELEALRANTQPQIMPSPTVEFPTVSLQPVQNPPPPPAPPPLIPNPYAKPIKAPPPPPPPKELSIPIPSDPNLITGIVRDSRGNPLQNILVEVKDQDENPVRAFKTNGLGQFASATALANGRYILILEDPKGEQKFDSVQVETVGVPIVPLEITSIDAREELRRQLFIAN